MRFGFAVPSYGPHADGRQVRDLLVAGDELGFDSAWFPDHVAVPDYARDVNLAPPFLEPLATCAWGLGITKRLRMGTDVLVASYRHPLLVAAVTGTLGRLAGDRLVLGVGIGYLRGEFEVLGATPYERRAEATDEFLRALRSEPEGYSVVSSPEPIPVWVGGNAATAQRRAALLGDGWHPLWMPDDRYAEARRHILGLRASEGLTGPFTFSYSCGATQLLTRSPASWVPTGSPASPRIGVPLCATSLGRRQRPPPLRGYARPADLRLPAPGEGRGGPGHLAVRLHQSGRPRAVRRRGAAGVRHLSGSS